MKSALQLFKPTCIVLLCAGLTLTCRKNDTTPVPVNPPPVGQVGLFNADTISNHLKFLTATKKPGKIPAGPAGISLKISFEDTLYLMDQIKRPIKFLHMDTTKDVAGVYMQLHHSFTGSTSTYYYNVPEIPEMAGSDSVSVILIGIDPGGLTDHAGVPPAGGVTFDITIVPYDKNGQPLGTTTRPVKLSQPNGPLSGSCGLVLPFGDYWDWHLTLIEDKNTNGLLFYNDRDKIWGSGGQNIKGCCINGISSYNINCSGNTTAQKSLHFPTYFQYIEELIKFFENGTFIRFTKELHALPDPDLSNFCGSGEGIVHTVQHNVTYEGNYTVTKLATPFKGDSFSLQFLTTTKTGGTGFGRSGGLIHQLDCNTLALIKYDNEGSGRDEVSFFARVTTGDDGWYELT
ncbi:MAG: hypothetical protein WKF97_17750 [Chitinophagaceae bacterium]